MSLRMAPQLLPLCTIACDVGPLVSLGDTVAGERRYVPLTGGSVQGPELSGQVVEGGVDWQWHRADGVLEIAAHYVLRADDGGLIEVRSEGLRHGPAGVMAALARGEAVRPQDYYFRTFIRFTTGATAWAHLNRSMAVAVGAREPRRVLLDLFVLT